MNLGGSDDLLIYLIGVDIRLGTNAISVSFALTLQTILKGLERDLL